MRGFFCAFFGAVCSQNPRHNLIRSASNGWAICATLVYLRHTGRIETPENEAPEVLAALLNHPVPAHVEVPEELRYEEVRVARVPSSRD